MHESRESWEEAIVRYRRDLHRIPELGFEETETAAYLEEALKDMGLRPRRLAGTGLAADIAGDRPGPTVAVRADIDGLPLEEETGLPFASGHEGRMHACGHDGHMAMVLGLARRLTGGPGFPGRIRVFFQPSEERPPGGAPALIREGVLEGVDRVLGLHLWSLDPVGTVRILPGALMANADEFVVRIHGRGGHGSEPENTQDAVLIAAQTVVNLQTVVSRRMPALEPAVLTCGTLQAGTTFNIIAEEAQITGTVRTFSDAARARMVEELRRIAEGTAALYGARAEVEYLYGYPAVINDGPSVALLEQAWAGLVDVVAGPPSMGAEDFAYYLKERPGAFYFLGARPAAGPAYPHHSPHFRFDEAALPLGVETLYRGALAFLGAGR